MKTMLKLSVFSLILAVTVNAETAQPSDASHAAAQPAATAKPTVEVTRRDPVAELTDKVNACLAERGRSSADAALFSTLPSGR